MTRILVNNLMIIAFTVGLTVNGFGQNKEISLEFGAGNTNINSHTEIVYPFERYYDAFYHAGAKYTITSKKGLNLYSGLTLDKKVLWRHHSEYYLKVPAGFHFSFGDKLKFHFGAGLNGGIHLGEAHNYKRFTLGTFINAGPSCRITDKYRVMLSLQSNFDITPIAAEQSTSQAGNVSGDYYNVRGFDGFLLLGIYRSIK